MTMLPLVGWCGHQILLLIDVGRVEYHYICHCVQTVLEPETMKAMITICFVARQVALVIVVIQVL